MTPLDIIEGKLHAHGQQPKRRGDTLTARCPAHDDHTPSLSVTVGRDRDIILHCHAGCDPNAIMSAIGLSWTDLSDRHKTQQQRHLEATYDYTDADGTLLYQVLRYHPKDFRQRRVDPDTGAVAWNLNGVERVPYNLPAVVDPANVNVWIVEGEKDADALTAAGVTATCNSGGAGKFTAEHAKWMAGKILTIVADDDAPGHAHARQVAELTADYRIGDVRILKPAHGKDVAEHLGAGLTLDDLLPLDAEDVAPHPLAPFLIDWDTFWTDEHHAEWLLEPLFADGRAHALYAGAKTGKSYLILAACAALAAGLPFLDHPGGTPVPVLYVDYEMTAEDVRDRLEEFGHGPDSDLTELHYALLPLLPPLDAPEGGQALLAAAQAVGARFVVIDTTSRSISGEENDADTMRAFYRCTGLLLKQAGIGWMRLDHAGKDASKGQRGSSAKNDDVDIVLKLERTDGGQRLTATHRRMAWFPESTDIAVGEDAHGVMRFTVPRSKMYADGTKELAEWLDSIGFDLDSGRPVARKVMNEHGVKGSNQCISDALRFRREQAETDLLPVDNLGITLSELSPDRPPEVDLSALSRTVADRRPDPTYSTGTGLRTAPDSPPAQACPSVPLPRGGQAAASPNDLPENQPDYDPTEF